ncbi:aldo/keto reductase [Enterococcus phoeniculicola]|uniref:Aldo/keto reductase n=2 Tax=Enterococcus phoeniculicola TaxID=154621 RepID=R3W3H9_9ENTE|nr:aldo/keto reductase [Enterococcus phoeniculicola ATCC BAA-412]EOT79494.1 aldo/keto reductase [Enterococcus phoeniculicola ATCC BAA-412]OJG69813.1 aldo/keto reductase [Enterococcus phoeniculicola]
MDKTKTLANGLQMPRLGLGVWRVEDSEAEKAVGWALEAGYRMIDTAMVYKNEKGVGEGIRHSSVPREDIFVTTKLWNDDQGYESALKAFDASLERLGLDYVDLYLIHWPVAGKYKDSWRALEEIYASGRAKAIGVSNFHQHHLEDLMTSATIKPMVDQIEIHPTLTQEPLRAYLASESIAVEAWSPLGQGKILETPTLIEIGKKYGKSAAQVIIRWHLQNDIIVIPKSSHEGRIKENFDVTDFELTPEEIQQINALNIDERLGSNPDSFDF